MKTNWIGRLIPLVILSLALASCAPKAIPSPAAPAAQPGSGAGIPNPAAAHCVEQGYKSEIRTAADGSQAGVCVFPDGSECDDWAYFRGECGPARNGTQPAADEAGQPAENMVVEILRGQLARELSVKPEDIEVTSLEAVNWPDACLGAPNAGEACAAAVTPGFRVILSTGENHITYHTDLTGETIRVESAGGKP